ncbi:hypothetical protein [Pseudomonas sp. CFBP 13602]|uniref:hypothetical protein n=1 Tax=Pseudomonas sp. CFBP 13602 TaxID=2774039 RepID=UPI001785027C|nr:hypothetical protein [Pseudomonas sp. CFBP 13602]MBD8828585.1 hypothetical protein [Pseudomonas sp. CFBP 13602]
MIYSRILHTEYEHPANEDGEGAYTVFTVVQPYKLNFKKCTKVCIQTFAILWKDTVDTRLISIVEKALINGVLPPVKALYAAKGNLNVIYSNDLDGDDYNKLYQSWSKLGLGVWYDQWITQFFSETEITHERGNNFLGEIRCIFQQHDLGIQPFTSEMFLFHEEWTPENVFGPDYAERAGATPNKDVIGESAFDDHDEAFPGFYDGLR